MVLTLSRRLWPLLMVLSLATSARGVDDEGIAYFETQIRPLLIEHCYECHAAGARTIEGSLTLDSRAGWTTGGDHGPAVVPGDPDASLLIQAVRYADAKLQMPPAGSLPSEAIRRLEHWVKLGAPDPRTDPLVVRETDGPRPSDPIAGKQHWAFLPLRSERAPDVQDATWPRSTIDRLILARLEAAELRPVPDAIATDLVRRLYFQLLGLPPTAAQQAVFAADRRPDRWEHLVDELIGSPHFGERWGRHWLDLARYADSNGLDENFLFREAWRYRNWVIDAVNADLPFDRFLVEQIAGDLLPYESVEQRDRQRIAAGFLVIGPKVLLGNEAQRQRLEVADEQIDTIGRAVLGQTLGCARCHDHKFDPIPTADYYALAGILTSTQVMEQRYMLGEQRVMERLVGLGPEGESVDAAYEKYWLDRPALKAQTDRAKSVLAWLNQDNRAAITALSQAHPDALAEHVLDANLSLEQRVAAQQSLVSQLEAQLATPPAIPPRAMIPTEATAPADETIRVAGQVDRPGAQVPRGFLQVLCEGPIGTIAANESGRRTLSQWLIDVEHGAGRLTARVIVNRLWHHLIGRGIVRTVDNFGRTGEAPSHPELLEYLANRLIDSGWSIKAVVREIALSRTFALSSEFDEARAAIDPENRWLWRAHRRRLEPEALRDAVLLMSNQLDLRRMNSSVWYLGDQATGVGENVRRRTDFPARSVYLPVIRNDLPEIFDVFDFANPHTTTGARPQTMVAPQGLFLLNDPLVLNAAEATAQRLLASETLTSPTARIETLFDWLYSTCPTDVERQTLLAFIEQTERGLSSQGDADPTLRAWTLACHALYAQSRFQFLE